MVSEPTATEVVAEVPAEVVTTDAVVETVEVVADVPAQEATTDVAPEADKPAN